MVRLGALAFMLASVAYLWYVARPSWDMVVDAMNHQGADQATSAMMLAALILIVLGLAGRSGPYRTSKMEWCAIMAVCVLVVTLTIWLVTMPLPEMPAYLYGPSLVGGAAVCTLMALRMIWTLQGGRVADPARGI